MSKGFLIISGIIGVGVLVFVLAYFNLGMFRFFAPKHENVRREVFENTKSFVKGKTQDLAQYYAEFSKAKTEEDRQIVREIIKMQFADFNASRINSPKLRTFLTNMRGY